MPLRAAIFDMDGILVDSEPLWARAEVLGFGRVGLHLTEAACHETVGMAIEEVVSMRHRQHPWTGTSEEDVVRDIMDEVVRLIHAEGRPLPGVREALAFLRGKGLRLGLATSSHPRVMDAVLDALHLRSALDHVQTAIGLEDVKPHPAVYLAAAAGLGVDPRACVAIEDSIPGLVSARAARMKAIAVPDPGVASDPRFALADVVLPSLRDLDDGVLDRL